MAFVVYVMDFVKNIERLTNVKRLSLFFALLLHAIYLLGRTLTFSHPPITNVFEIFTVIAFAIAFAYFVLELATDIRNTGAFIIVIALTFQIISSLFIKNVFEVKEILRSNLLGAHVFSALIGYAGITISAVYGFLYLRLYKELKQNRFGLIFERLPNLEILESLSFYSAIIGFALLSVAMTIGIIWLPRVFPNFSYTDPKLIATAIVWLVYGLGIIGKITGKWMGKKVVVFSIAGFLIAICSTVITNFISRSFHSFY
jgi:ABC-type uncharacterized transport system permease subunit